MENFGPKWQKILRYNRRKNKKMQQIVIKCCILVYMIYIGRSLKYLINYTHILLFR